MNENLFVRINNDLMKALKEKQEQRLNVLRMVKSKILYVNARGDLPDADLIKIVIKYAKELKESIEEFKKLGRTAEIEVAQQELAIVQEYLPKEIGPDELKSAIKAIITSVGAATMKDMGKVMKVVQSKYPGADGKLVSQLVRESLS
jgi:uncharacterized protein YqeY